MQVNGEEKRALVLDPIERVSEVIFGLLMAMTFVGSLSVATAGEGTVRTMMITALGCNLAWGLTDAVMYLVRTVTDRARHRTLYSRLCNEADSVAGQALIAKELAPRIAAAAGSDGLEMLRRRMVEASGVPVSPRLRKDDFQGAIGIFLLVTLATFPVVVPFMLVDEVALALRVSNLVALGMLFLAGWVLARYAGVSTWYGGTVMTITGTLLIFTIIALGG